MHCLLACINGDKKSAVILILVPPVKNEGFGFFFIFLHVIFFTVSLIFSSLNIMYTMMFSLCFFCLRFIMGYFHQIWKSLPIISSNIISTLHLTGTLIEWIPFTLCSTQRLQNTHSIQVHIQSHEFEPNRGNLAT